jgi:glyoxylase-like metal-dependent hydrolase (beta-lactamase superfamily II)
MSGRILVGGDEQWTGGEVTPVTECVLAPNASAWTLDGTNTWIVGHRDSACVVVDPGPLVGGHREAIEQRIEERGHRVAGVVLTHGHIDHSAGAPEFAKRHGVAVRAWDPRHTTPTPGKRDQQSLASGEVIDIDGLAMSVLATPGHSSDSVCLLVDDIVLTGDSVLGRGTSLVAHPDGRLADYFASLNELSRLCSETEVSVLLPGHGPVISDPQRVVEYYISHRYERLSQVRVAVEGGAVSAREVVEVVYADVPREVWPAAEATVRAQLEFLANQGDE